MSCQTSCTCNNGEINMDINIAKKALEKLAQREKVSIEVIKNEIGITIDEVLKSPNPEISDLWKAIPCKDEYPTPEELVVYLVQLMS